MVLADHMHGKAYMKEIVAEHVSGQLKIAPEHSEDHVLANMGKTGRSELIRFKKLFDDLTAEAQAGAVPDLLSDRGLSRLH